MVKITAESGNECREIEGKASIVFIIKPVEGGDYALMALANGVKSMELLIGAAQALGHMAVEFYSNSFERALVLSFMAKEMMKSPEKYKVIKKEGTVKNSDDED